ncbi:MAG TPA: DUF4124 domain-containing protein [Pelomicrobium sp.]|nr:DUF4124 domain-containing protein [Pelomicrobium sp.]
MGYTLKPSALSLAALATFVAGTPALAQTMYKHVDTNGRVTYSSEPVPGGKPMTLEPLTTLDPLKGERAAAARQEARAELLARDLAFERDRLAASLQALAMEKQKPEAVRASHGGGQQASGRYEDNIRTLTEQVESQRRRVEMLERELAALGAPAPGGTKQ